MNKKILELKEALKEKNYELSKTTCCFTGHRPQNLPWGFNEKDERCLRVMGEVEREVQKAIERGYTTFITGMALGFDIMCAEVVLKLKKHYPNIKLIGALPCRTQDKLWSEKDKLRYRDVLKKLDKIRCIYENYIGSECMMERNRYMINNSSLVIALFNGSKGGTKRTLEYAKKQGVECIILSV